MSDTGTAARHTPRRTILHATTAGLALAALGRRAGAAERYPAQAVRYVNLFAAGGATDILSRAYCHTMSELAGQQFVVENRAGAGGTVGQAAIAQAPPDGYTLGLGSIASLAIAPSIYPSLPYNPARDFTYVAGIWQVPNVLFCNRDIPAHSLPEMVALVRAEPGRFLYGSGGSGTSPHLTMEWLKQVAGLDMQHVPYRGGAPALTDLMAGRIHFAFDNIATVAGAIRQEQVRPLAVTGPGPSGIMPDVPTMNRFYPGFEVTSWGGLVGPAGLPPQIVARLAELTDGALRQPSLQRVMAENGADPWHLSGRAFALFRDEQEALFARLVRLTGASAN